MDAFSLTSGVKFYATQSASLLATIESAATKTHLFAREVDAHGAVPDQVDRHLVLVTRHARDDYIANLETVLQRPALLVLDRVLLFPEPGAPAESLHASHIDRVHFGAVVCQKRSERPAHDFRAVDDCDSAPVQPASILEDRVVDLQMFQNLDNGEWGAGQDALLLVGGRIQKSSVLVHVVDKVGSQALDILALRHDVLDGAVAGRVEDGVVDNDAVNGAVFVGGADGVLEVFAFDFFQCKGKATALHQPPCLER